MAISYQQYLIAFLAFGFAYYVRQILVYLRFWQLKQYRWDRLKDDFYENWEYLIPKSSIISFLVVTTFFLIPRDWFLSLILINFLVWGSHSLIQLVRKKWIYPEATKKMKLFFSCYLVLFIFISSIFLYLSPYYLPLAISLFIIFLPLITFILLKLMEWPVSLLKKRIIKKAAQHRDELKNLKVIGITGSFGKTSVKDFLYHFLSFKYGEDSVARTDQNENTELGIAQKVITLNSKHRFFVCEMGAYHPGEIKRSASLVKPQMGVLTGLNNQHLSLFGSKENIIATKFELIKALPQNGLAIFNGDNEDVVNLYHKTTIPKLMVTTHRLDLADWQAHRIEIDKSSLKFEMASKDENIPMKANLVGRQNIINLMMAGALALKLGLNSYELSQACTTLKPSARAPKIFNYHRGNIIDASYSSNVDGAQAHIKHLDLWKGRKVVVSFGFIELGKSKESAYYQLGETLGRGVDLAIFTREKHLDLVKQGVKDVGGKTEIIFTSSFKEIIRRLQEFRKEGDVILFEGRIPIEVINFFKTTI